MYVWDDDADNGYATRAGDSSDAASDGRPSQARSKVLQVRLTEVEFQAVERAAAHHGSRASTLAREHLMNLVKADVGPVWTRDQRTHALNALNVVRAATVSTDAATNIAGALAEVANLVPGGANASNAAFAEVAPDIITGLVNVAAMLAEHAAQRTGLSVDKVIGDAAEAVRTVRVSD